LPEQCGVVKIHAAGIGEAVLVYGGELRPADREKVEENPEHKTGVVEPERPQPEALAKWCPIGSRITQAKIDQPDGEQPKRAKQGGMRMIQRQKGAVLVIIDQRRVQRAAAEDAGADEIPERGTDDVGVGEPVINAC